MSYIPLSAQDEKDMLAVIGVRSVDDLFADVPKSVVLKDGLNLPPGMSESELKAFFRKIGKNNETVTDRPCFLGAGSYYHDLPSCVKAVVSRPEFLTSYTPYQPEISQGTLQVLFDFQTYMTKLTGMEVSNASLYDGASAVAEAALMGLRIKRGTEVFCSRALHPEYRATMGTLLEPKKVAIQDIPLKGTVTDLEALRAALTPNAVVVLQYPNFLGSIEDLKGFADAAHAQGAYLVVAIAEVMNLALLPTPGSLGADLCAGSAQSFGNALSYGGPHVGFLTCRMADLRQMPGRVVGATTDQKGREGLALTFQAREQHIRRDRAMSNVCTTMSLMANFTSAWLYLKGGIGAQGAAIAGAAATRALAEGLGKIPGFQVLTTGYVNEVVVRGPKAGLADFLAEWGLVAPYDLSGDYPEFKDCVLAACTELTTVADLETFLSAAEEFAGVPHSATLKARPTALPAWISAGKAVDIAAHSEVETVRYYTALARKNFGMDDGFYPLGSCTMKYNPKVSEEIVAAEAWTDLHPAQREDETQGALQVMFELEQCLKEVTGCHALTLQPAAGAQGELTALLMARRYFLDRGETARVNVIVPDSSHGTNPASASMAGFNTVSIPTDPRGNIDVAALKAKVGPDTAVLMLTNPSTLGLFEENILEVQKIVHEAGGLLYYDGANMNAILGLCRPGDMGFDLVHLNLHKSFATPHGGGGPGSGPVGCSKALEPFLPEPRVRKEGNRYFLWTGSKQSIGRVKTNTGNFSVLVRALAYCKRLGKEGLERVGRVATLNANYLLARLKPHYPVPYDRVCKHEFVLGLEPLKKQFGISALDLAKRLIDFHYHPPTIYFPLVVHEAVMIEPTETEPKAVLDKFVEDLIQIRGEIEKTPEVLREAPHDTPVSRLDDVKAVKEPKLTAK